MHPPRVMGQLELDSGHPLVGHVLLWRVLHGDGHNGRRCNAPGAETELDSKTNDDPPQLHGAAAKDRAREPHDSRFGKDTALDEDEVLLTIEDVDPVGGPPGSYDQGR